MAGTLPVLCSVTRLRELPGRFPSILFREAWESWKRSFLTPCVSELLFSIIFKYEKLFIAQSMSSNRICYGFINSYIINWAQSCRLSSASNSYFIVLVPILRSFVSASWVKDTSVWALIGCFKLFFVGIWNLHFSSYLFNSHHTVKIVIIACYLERKSGHRISFDVAIRSSLHTPNSLCVDLWSYSAVCFHSFNKSDLFHIFPVIYSPTSGSDLLWMILLFGRLSKSAICYRVASAHSHSSPGST